MIKANVIWAWHRIGYWVRPFDMLADQRRWFWQEREVCQGYAARKRGETA